MAIGALIGAYQEDDSGGLRALLPLAGRTLLEYQVSCAAAAGAAPIVVVVERMPQSLQDALERLRLEGVGVIAVSDVNEAVSRFEAGSMILLIGDGVVAPVDVVARLGEEAEPAVGTVPDDERHLEFERIDAEARWAGVAVVDANLLASTARMLGDWDLQSTLLRRTLQEGARRVPLSDEAGATLLVESPDQLGEFQRNLLHASRSGRTDWASRYVLPLAEDFATERLMETGVRPAWLLWAAAALTLAAALCFTRGWLGAGLALLILSTPLDLIAARLATLRLKPLATRLVSRRALWPLAGIALLSLGWWEWQHNSGWGAMVTALSTVVFAEAARIEQASMPGGNEQWLFSRRNAIFAAVPFALAGSWTAYLLAMLAYAALSFLLLQRVRHNAVS
ncbi:MAG TPA: NTP transferase domain-containing protein [Sphingomicrobium sp.]|nr:NTP transferase domain-containing protein [Sphingomicrobium sp.]